MLVSDTITHLISMVVVNTDTMSLDVTWDDSKYLQSLLIVAGIASCIRYHLIIASGLSNVLCFCRFHLSVKSKF
ncbi:hypothetical protein Nepgr_000304 [Nepenthes gracilis]|uniref:Uncharacterized protein n=1 Tax=Nepenthes gracilis TaxID=150966 RepID=A0AAD3P495_NEPGR|nr:hypothetical protein Nepgr_000304 [Nepenthes gracilis]